jgi:hypothetical protein
MFGIKHPVLLAGMNVAAGPKLAAAVSNAGGLGVIGGVGYTPDMLKEQIAELKSYLNDKNAPFGVDLLLPQVGGSARKTKYVYTHKRAVEGGIPTDWRLVRWVFFSPNSHVSRHQPDCAQPANAASPRFLFWFTLAD